MMLFLKNRPSGKGFAGFMLFLMCTLLTIFNLTAPASAQQINDPVSFIQEFNKFHQELPRERIHVQTDRDTYFAGERVWFSAWVTASSGNLISEISSLLYVELHGPDGDLVDRTLVKLDSGRGSGTLTTAEATERPGTYTVAAYTAWALNQEQKYVFSKPVNILTEGHVVGEPEAGSPASISVKPESGAMIADVPVRVAMQVSDDAGIPVETEIRIEGSNGFSKILPTNSGGTAIAEITPETGVTYTIKAGEAEKSLPEVTEEGVRFQTTASEDGQIALDVRSAGGFMNEPLIVAGHVKGRVYYAGEIFMQNGRGMNWVSGELFPSGLVQFTLIAPDGSPVTDRVIMNRNRVDESRVEISAHKEEFSTRERVQLGISLKDAKGEAVSGTVSVSVYDESFLATDGYLADIRNSFWFESGLAPWSFGDVSLLQASEKNPEHAEALLILADPPYTHETLFDPDKLTLFSLPEEGITVAGTIRTGFRGRPIEEAAVMFSLGDTQDDMFLTDTSPEGRFAVRGLDITGSEVISIRANDSRGRDNVRIELEEQFAHLPALGREVVQRVVQDDEETQAETPSNQFERVEQSIMRTERHVVAELEMELEEVVVTAEREDIDERLRRMATGDDVGSRITLEDRPELQELGLLEVISRLPGVQVRGESIQVRTGFMTMTAGSDPLVLVDGSVFDIEILRTIPSQDVASVTVLRRPDELARFGANAASGVISVRTHIGAGPQQQTRGLLNAFVQGYDPSPAFFSPRYGGAERDSQEQDNRITLHWEPKLNIGSSGGDVLFWTGDVPGTYRIVVEGLCSDGIPIRGETEIRVSSQGERF